METLAELWADEEIQAKFASLVQNGKIWDCDDLADKLQEQMQVDTQESSLKKKSKR